MDGQCYVFWPANACLRKRSHGRKQWKTPENFQKSIAWALHESLMRTMKNYFFGNFQAFFIAFNHVNAWASMRSLVEIHNRTAWALVWMEGRIIIGLMYANQINTPTILEAKIVTDLKQDSNSGPQKWITLNADCLITWPIMILFSDLFLFKGNLSSFHIVGIPPNCPVY